MPDDQQQQQTPPINLADPAALTAAYQQYLQYLQQVGNQRPAQAPVISQAQLDANRPTSLLGQLGEALGGGAPSDVPMTSDQRERAGLRGLFNFSRGLLGTGTFDSIGQALDRGFTEAERGQYNQEAQVAYGQAAAQDWQRQQMADRLAALKESIPLLQGIQRLNMPSLYGPGGGPGSQAGNTPGTVPSAFTGDLEKDRQIIAQRESGGNPTILNYVARADPTAYARGATASGKYQFVNSTWRQGMQEAGLSAADQAKYPTAMSAPESVQDQVFTAVYKNHGTAPWDPSKFGANWVQQPGGGYQLVKGAPYTPPTQVAQQSPATPAQPAGKPPAPSGGGETAALPVPPREPPGAVPTVTTPEEAKATAAAAGTPVQVPNTQGLWATPQGGMTSTPRLIMPGTDVASVTPTVPAAPGPQPPPGAVPPAPQPPAQQPPAQPATPQQPPAPTPAPASRAQDFSVADKDLTPEEYMDRHFVALTPEQVKTYAPGPAGDVAAAAADQVQRAKQQVAAAETQLDQMRRAQFGQADLNRAQGQVNDANKELDAAENAYNKAVQDAAQAGAGRLLERDNAERARVTGNYKADVIDPRNKAAELEQQARQQIELENVKTGNQTSAKLLEAYNTDAANSGKRIDDLELLRGLSDNAGSPTALTSIKVGDRSLADIISATGFGGKDLQDRVGAIQAFRAGVLNTVRELRTGGAATGEPRSNQDLQFVQDMAPNEWQSPATRNAIISFLQQVNQRRIDMAAEVSRLTATRGPNGQLMPAGEAVAQARKNLPDFVPKMPDNAIGNTPEALAARKEWFANVPPHSFFRYPNGRIDLYNGPGGQ